MKKYKMVQLEESAYLKLKEYCEENGYKMGPELKRWIEQKTYRNILKVRK